jgi:hypothetical protein
MDAFYVQFFARYPFLSGGLYLTGEVWGTRGRIRYQWLRFANSSLSFTDQNKTPDKPLQMMHSFSPVLSFKNT